MRADLHAHSTASDGAWSPAAVFAAAEEAGLEWFALTDHDTLDGWRDITETSRGGMRLVRGIELSTTWSGVGVHIVGLNVAADDPTLKAGVAQQTRARGTRAERIAEVLTKAGFTVDLEAIKALGTGAPGRPHFAEYLVNTGQVSDRGTVFKRYLGAGKPGDIKTGWASMPEVIHWIRSAGGIATLAHPARYKLTRMKLGRMVDAFAQEGGQAIEVISGAQTTDVTQHIGSLSQQHKLLASCGSDFHSPEVTWSALGMPMVLPATCAPVWEAWR